MACTLMSARHRAEAHPVLILVGLLAVAIVIAVQCGAVAITGRDWLAWLWSWRSDAAMGGAHVLGSIRLPRAVFAVGVGAALGLAGALTQGLFRNPLADPGLLGVTSGAACAAALVIVLLAAVDLPLPLSWRLWVLPLAAATGAILVCFTLDRIARAIAPGSIAGLLLTGIALNALAGAVIGICTFIANDEQLRSLSFWMLGSLAGASWPLAASIVAMVVIASWRSHRLAQAMNALALGEATAAHVGVDVEALRRTTIRLVAVLSGFAVAWCGIIGFVGLIAPHFVRLWLGPDQRVVAPLSMLVGAILLVAADTMARSLAIPAEIPVGIFTALLGAPFFILLLGAASGRVA